MSEVERLRLMVAKLEIENERLKKDIGWKETVQSRNTLLEAEGLRNRGSPQSEVSSKFSVSNHGA